MLTMGMSESSHLHYCSLPVILNKSDYSALTSQHGTFTNRTSTHRLFLFHTILYKLERLLCEIPRCSAVSEILKSSPSSTNNHATVTELMVSPHFDI